jgi:ubiquinone/menaquinone biosynthesis C-methylase UbiE
MKKHIIILLCVMSNINAMEQQIIKREPREWDPEAYILGNKIQRESFLHFIATNNVDVNNKNILSAGCGTAENESILAKQAEHIHGFDASKNMIDYAQKKYGHIKNLSFEHCFAEDFQSKKYYDLAIASFCIHWFENKKQAFQRINNSLTTNGEFFGTITTSDNPKPKNLTVFLEMMPTITWLYNFITSKKLEDLIGASYPSLQETRTMLEETNFDIITCEEQTFKYTLADKEDLKKFQWPILSSRPIVKYIPETLIEPLFETFIDRMIEKLQKNEDGSFTETMHTTIIHARKIKK